MAMANKRDIKIIPQVFEVVDGIKRSWSIIIDGMPRFTFYSAEEVESFLRGLKNE